MGMASFCAGVRRKRYNGQLEIAPKKVIKVILGELCAQ
jgi:hypothetical protein